MALTFNEQLFEQKLVSLKDTQEAINALSSWCLQHKEHHKKIVICWLHCLKRVKIDQRLSLFYLANDVIQYSKRKHLDFVESWGTALQRATPLVRDDKVRHRIQRIFKIWEERGVYDEAFISDLCGLLTTTKKKSEPVEHVTDPADFQPTALVRKIKEIKVLEENTDIKFKRIKDNKLPLTDAESMRLSLKDRRHGSDVAAEVDNGVKKMEAFVKALESEISSREKLLDLLRQATLFYETQRGEAKIVANAYRNFGGRLKSRQKALEEVIASMLSPLPSPDVNAPSPSPDSDFDSRLAHQEPSAVLEQDVPLANGADLGFSLVNSSFIGSSQFLDLSKEVFSGEPAPQPAAEAQPIEVIGGREQGANFDVAEFLKSLMPPKETSLPPPPMPPVFADWNAGGPWDQPPSETPQSPPIYEKQVTHIQPVEYDDSMPVHLMLQPPMSDVDHRSLLTVPGPLPDMVLPPVTLGGPLISGDLEHRGPPPPITLAAPSPLIGMDMDHRGPVGMGLPNMDVPPPALSERGALIAPPPPVGMLGPPPPPPAVKALLDVDQRNLINLTGSPANRGATESYRNRIEETHFQLPRVSYPAGGDVYPQRQSWGMHRTPDVRDTDSRVKDNVESIDMDVSEEDDEESQARAGGDLSEQRHFSGPSMRGGHVGHPPYGAPPPLNESSHAMYDSLQHKPSLGERLTALSSAGAKLVAPIESPSPDKNGFTDNNEFGEDGGEDYGGDYGGESEDFVSDFVEDGVDYGRDYGGNIGGVEFRREFTPRPRWQSPRPPRGPRPMRGSFPYRAPHRGHPRFFHPRGRW